MKLIKGFLDLKVSVFLVLLLLAFFAGTMFDFILTKQPDTNAITNIELIPLETKVHDRNKVALLEQKLDTMLSMVNDITYKLDEISKLNSSVVATEQVQENNNFTANDASSNLTVDEITEAKNVVYSSLSDPGFTFTQLVSLPELNTLPPAAKKEFFDEVARRIDSGEIDKEAFLPGYVQH